MKAITVSDLEEIINHNANQYPTKPASFYSATTILELITEREAERNQKLETVMKSRSKHYNTLKIAQSKIEHLEAQLKVRKWINIEDLPSDRGADYVVGYNAKGRKCLLWSPSTESIAQIVDYDDLVPAGSESAAKAAGKLRTEGKTYVMQPGDIVEFRFNV